MRLTTLASRGLILAATLVMAACSPKTETIKIGVAQPLSGPRHPWART